MTKKAAIYTRVSTAGQTTENQCIELQEAAKRHGWDVVAVFEDKGISGAKGREERPQLDALLKAVGRREFDVVMAWSVDRLGRSLQDLVGTLGEFHAKGVDLYLDKQGIDTTTPAGKAMFQMMGVFAEFEREMIRERVRTGIARAKERGTRSGRPIGRPQTSPKVLRKIQKMRADGVGKRKIARTLGVGVSVVMKACEDQKRGFVSVPEGSA